MKLIKVFECSCIDGYTGDFCEFKTERDHLLFVSENDLLKMIFSFNANGSLIDESPVIDGQVGVYRSCSTILNGEAIIFGGFNASIQRQVHQK